MASAAHARSTAPAPRREQEARPEAPAYAYRAPATRRRAAQRSRLMRTFIIFVGCLTVLAVGRVALSFAVVQKSLQTEAIVREERRVSDKNGELREKVAQLSSAVRIEHIARDSARTGERDALLVSGSALQQGPLRGRGEPLMAAPPTGRRRPAGRRGGGLFGSPKPARRGVDGRIRLLRFVFIVFLVLVGGKAVALASSSQHLTWIAQQQQTQKVVLPAHRGSILDRNGSELAVGKPQQTVVADPHLLVDPRAAADELCDALQINRRKARRAVEDKLVAGKQQKSWFTYVARKVDPELAKAALALDLPGVVSYTEEKRMYPLKATAAQVLGFAGTENKGLAGIELLYDKDLSGRAGSETVVRDPAGHALKTVAHQEPKSGQNVRLTLDSQIQYYAEDVLEKTVRDTGGTSATSIVMDPRTGEILAMANVTKEGFHGFGKGDQSAEKNRAVTDVVRARLDLQAGHHLRSPGGRHRDSGHEVHASAEHPRGRPRDQRVAPARDGRRTRYARSSSGRATWAPSRSACRWAKDGLYQVDQGVRLRQADRDPVPR